MKNIYSITSSINPDTEKAVNEIQSVMGKDKKLILFFASSNYEPSKLSNSFSKAFAKTTVVGCTTSGEIITGRMLDNAVVAIGFDDDCLKDFSVEIVQGIKTNPDAVATAFKQFENHFGKSESLHYDEYVGIVLTDGLGGTEELVMDKIGNLTDITFIGGSTGDDMKFKETTLYYNNEIYHEGSLLLLLKPKQKFSTLKTQSFRATGKKLLVTKGDESKRKVIEFNHKPATEAYAEAMEIPLEQLAGKMFYSPLGLMSGDEPFVRSPRTIENSDINFFCSVKEGTELMLLESTDIVEDTISALLKKEKEGNISCIINFNCILRTLDLKKQNKTKEYGEVFKNHPTVGFSTYGESFIGHINQTATMLIFFSDTVQKSL